jgi:hypothetical protein
MGLKDTFKLNMEICYVPVAKLKDVQEMMANWNDNNKYIKYCSLTSIAISFINLFYLNISDSDFAMLMCIIGDIIMAALAFLVNKSNKLIYYFAFIGTMLFSFSASFIRLEALTLPTAIALSLPFLITCFFSYKAILNYEDVYLKLKERKGFPHFVFSTADMYAEKIYLKDKNEKTVAEKRVEAAYNPFNEQSDILDEEVERMNSLRYDEIKHLEQDVAGKEYYKDKEKKNRAEEMFKFSRGLKIGNVNIIIPHDKIEESPKEKNRIVMGEWNDMKKSMFKNETVWICVILANVMIHMWTMPSVKSLLLYPIVAAYIFGTNFVKMENIIGLPLVLCVYLLAAINTPMVTPAILALFTIIKLPGYVRWLINLPIYKKLSRQPGFPSFIETTTDKYADQFYIVEKREPIKKGPSLDPIIMNIGYDDDAEGKRIGEFDYKGKNKENVQEENTAWNAFNYLETDTENSAYDEFEIYEEVNRRRREAAVAETTVQPNKNMGRRKTDED